MKLMWTTLKVATASFQDFKISTSWELEMSLEMVLDSVFVHKEICKLKIVT